MIKELFLQYYKTIITYIKLNCIIILFHNQLQNIPIPTMHNIYYIFIIIIIVYYYNYFIYAHVNISFFFVLPFLKLSSYNEDPFSKTLIFLCIYKYRVNGKQQQL